MPTGALGQTRLRPALRPAPLVPLGMVLGAVAMLCFTGVDVDSSYATDVLPGLLVMGLGLGLIMRAGDEHRDARRRPRSDAGVASAMVNTGQQVGGSIGTALLSTLAATRGARATRRRTRPSPPTLAAQAAVHGYTTAFRWSAGDLRGRRRGLVAAAAERRAGGRPETRRRAGVRPLSPSSR